MFISKWWGNNIGGSDDSLLLMDYFGLKALNNFELKQIIKDIRLDTVQMQGSFQDGDLFFKVNDDFEPHFHMSTSVLTDLSAIVLESLNRKQVSIKDLDTNSKYDKTFTIQADKEDIISIKNSLDYFIDNANTFEIAGFMSKADFGNFIVDCQSISTELLAYTV